MFSIESMLRKGVRKIISQFTPMGNSSEGKQFLYSQHPHRELCFVIDGCSEYMLNGSVYQANPGTVFMIDSWVPHAFGYRECDKGLLHLWFHIHDSGLSAELMRIAEHGEFRLEAREIVLPEDFKIQLSRRWELLNSLAEITEDAVRIYMTSPINAILDEFSFQTYQQTFVSKNRIEEVIAALKRYIQRVNARGCSLRRLERISGYSRYHLSRLFRRHAGCTIGEYIDKVRKEYTVAAMRHGLTQKEIAFELGFSSPSNFWNWLQKHKETLPDI